MIKKKTKVLELAPEQATALMVMLDSEMETIFDEGIDPIADWENADLYAYRLLAYKTYRQWYMDNHYD